MAQPLKQCRAVLHDLLTFPDPSVAVDTEELKSILNDIRVQIWCLRVLDPIRRNPVYRYPVTNLVHFREFLEDDKDQGQALLREKLRDLDQDGLVCLGLCIPLSKLAKRAAREHDALIYSAKALLRDPTFRAKVRSGFGVDPALHFPDAKISADEYPPPPAHTATKLRHPSSGERPNANVDGRESAPAAPGSPGEPSNSGSSTSPMVSALTTPGEPAGLPCVGAADGHALEKGAISMALCHEGDAFGGDHCLDPVTPLLSKPLIPSPVDVNIAAQPPYLSGPVRPKELLRAISEASAWAQSYPSTFREAAERRYRIAVTQRLREARQYLEQLQEAESSLSELYQATARVDDSDSNDKPSADLAGGTTKEQLEDALSQTREIIAALTAFILLLDRAFL